MEQKCLLRTPISATEGHLMHEGQTLLMALHLHSRISEEINSSVVGSKDKLAALAAVFGIKGNMAMRAATCDLIACYG